MVGEYAAQTTTIALPESILSFVYEFFSTRNVAAAAQSKNLRKV